MEEDKLMETDPVSRQILTDYSTNLLKIAIDTVQLMRNVNANSEVNSDGND